MSCKKILRPKGFTLTELLVVVLIISILAAVAMPLYNRAVERSRASDALKVIALAAAKQEAFLLSNERMALNFDELGAPVRNLTGEAPTIGSFTYTLHPACIAARRTTGAFTVFRNFNTNEEACFGTGCWVLNNMVPTVNLGEVPDGCNLEPDAPCVLFGGGVQGTRLCKDIPGGGWTTGTSYFRCTASCEGSDGCYWDDNDCRNSPQEPCEGISCNVPWRFDITTAPKCCVCDLECEAGDQCFNKHGESFDSKPCTDLNGISDISSTIWIGGTASRRCASSCNGPECEPWDTSACIPLCLCSDEKCPCPPGECCSPDGKECKRDPDKEDEELLRPCGEKIFVDGGVSSELDGFEDCDTCSGILTFVWTPTPGCPRTWESGEPKCVCQGEECCYDTTKSVCRLKTPCGPETRTRPCPNGYNGVQRQERYKVRVEDALSCPNYTWSAWGKWDEERTKFYPGQWDNSECGLGCTGCKCDWDEYEIEDPDGQSGNVCVKCPSPKVAASTGNFCICPRVTLLGGGGGNSGSVNK